MGGRLEEGVKWPGYRPPVREGRQVVADGRVKDEESWSERLRAWIGYSKVQVTVLRIML